VGTSERHDELLAMMRRRADWRIEDLAAALDVSKRTVLRDLARLRARGFDISSMSGPGGGVNLEPTSVMVTSQLSGDEVVALILSVAISRAAPFMPFADGAERALAKIQAALPTSRAAELQRFMQRVLVGEPAPRSAQRDGHRIHKDLVSRFEQAFTANRLLGFAYVDREGAATQRRVEPHGFLLRTPLWYIIAWDPDKEAARLFRADRITRPRVLDARFTPRPHELVAGVCRDALPAGWPSSQIRSPARFDNSPTVTTVNQTRLPTRARRTHSGS
jgi:predicted DNA-binding transcriptional regulator YafY